MLRTLLDPVKGPSYDVEVTPFQDAVGTKTSRWAWLEETVKVREVLDGKNGPAGAESAYPGVYGTEYQELVRETAAGQDDQRVVPRPEHALFNLAMVGGGRVYGQAHLYGMLNNFSICPSNEKTFAANSLCPRLSMGQYRIRDSCRRRWWHGYVSASSCFRFRLLLTCANRRLLSTTVANLSKLELCSPRSRTGIEASGVPGLATRESQCPAWRPCKVHST